jgi:signal transduction histidine kinase
MSPATSDQHIRRLERLLEVCRSLGKSQDIQALLQSVVDAACELTRSEVSTILLYEAETDLLKFVAGPSSHKATSLRLRVPLDKSLAGWVYKNSKPVVVQDANKEPRIAREVETPLGHDLHSMLAVPLYYQGETIGVLEAINKRNHADYTEEDVTILETLASQAAVATLGALLLEETKRAYDQIEELEKMKSNFIAIAAHELRTPLGLILGHSTFLMETVKDETQRHQLDVIIRSASRLKKIIEDISAVNTAQTGTARVKRSPIMLDKLFQRVANQFHDTARRKRVSLVTKLPDANLTIEGDEEKIGLALSNLISNAIAFTNENGHVLVTAEALPGYIKISVIDDGIGIPSKDLPKVFDRFFQVQSHLTRRHGGMGLGLSVAKAMIELHGGQIWVESVESRGSNFSILLPSKLNQPPKVPAFQ